MSEGDSFEELFEDKEPSTSVKLMDEAIRESIENECGLTSRNGSHNPTLQDKLDSVRNKAQELGRERK